MAIPLSVPLKPAHAAGLRNLSLGVAMFTPVGMAIAHRSAAVYVILAAVLALGAAAAEGRLPDLAKEARRRLADPLGLAALAFFGLAALSIAWSDARALSLHALGEFGLSVGGAFLLALALPARLPRWSVVLLAASILVACMLILAELHTDLLVRRAVGLRSLTAIFNRPALTVLVLAVPLLMLLASRPHDRRMLAIGAVAALAVLWVALDSDSGAALLGLAGGLVGFAVARLSKPLAVALLGLGLLGGFAVAPWLGEMTARAIPDSAHESLKGAHSRERVALWRSFGAAARARPVLGAGFGVSRRIAETSLVQEVEPPLREMLRIGHPHNAALQIWTELGLVGVVVSLALLGLLLRRLAALPRARFAVSLSLFAGASCVALVGHGAWQGWWAAVLGLAVVLLARSVEAADGEPVIDKAAAPLSVGAVPRGVPRRD
jgi:exopolysaccharide production protein ExoQ